MKSLKLLFILLFFITISEAADLKKVSLQLQWKYQFQFAGFIIAKEKGFYKEIGLDVDIKEWNHNINMADEVLNSNSTYSIARPTSLIDIAKGKDIILLATIFQSSPLALVTTNKSKIKSIKDFKNKKMMSSGDMDTDASFMAMMFSQGIDIKDIIIQKPSFDIQDLINGKTDLIASYISNEPFILKELGVEPIIFSPKDYGFDFYNDILITSQKYSKENPKQVNQFIEASLKGWEYAFSNIDETVKIILKKYNTQKKSKDALLYEAKELKKLSYYKTDKIGTIEKYKLEKIYDIYKLLGLVKKDINFSKFIFNPQSVNITLTKEEKEYLKNKKVINMCIDPNWMPFEKLDENGKYIGMSADYFNIFTDLLKTNIKVIKTKTWNESMEFAKDKKCDILSLVMRTQKREKYLNFTTPYLKTSLVIATKLNIPFINDIDLIKNKKVAITKGYAFIEILKNKYPNLNIIEVENIEEGLIKVNQGELFGYIGTLASIGYNLQTQFNGELKIAGKFYDNWELSIGVRDDDIMLLNILQKAINNLNSKQQQKILNDWISIKYEKGIDYTLIWQILVVISFILLAFLYKQRVLKKLNYSLKSKVYKKTKALAKINKELEKNKNDLKLLNNTLEQKVKEKTFELKTKNNELQQYLNVIDEIKIGLFIVDSDYKVQYMNNTMIEWFGDQTNKICYKSVAGLEEPCPYCKIQDVIELGQKVQYTPQTPDGQIFEIISAPIQNKDGTVSKMEIIRNITKQTSLQERLFKSEKLASMGEMIGNIAHQWRQPLSVISTASTGMKMQKEFGTLTDEQFIDNCDAINDNAQYLSRTIDDFKNFIKGDSKAINFDLKNDTDAFLKIVNSTIKNYHIDVILNLQENINIKGYPNELIQCFINIFNNAKDALVEHNKENNRFIFISQEINNNKITIKFKDNAGGIPNDVLPKIFDPYFTTKHQSQGTGLGLHMSYNLIVKGMSGSIEVNNVSYEFNDKNYTGAEFTIILPIS